MLTRSHTRRIITSPGQPTALSKSNTSNGHPAPKLGTQPRPVPARQVTKPLAKPAPLPATTATASPVTPNAIPKCGPKPTDPPTQAVPCSSSEVQKSNTAGAACTSNTESGTTSNSNTESGAQTNRFSDLIITIDPLREVRLATLPPKSRAIYSQYYQEYSTWCKENGDKSIPADESLLLYFGHLSQTYAPTTLWTRASAIKSFLYVEFNRNKSSFPAGVEALLKARGRGYVPKKSFAFDKEEVEKYLQLEATSSENICEKLAFSLGILGGMRGGELVLLCWDNFEIMDDTIVCHFKRLKKSENDAASMFVLSKNSNESLCVYRLFMEYFVRVPEKYRKGRFWLKYDKKCKIGWTTRPLGKAFFSKLPKVVAKKLKLDNPEKYTGHSLRSTCATILADEGQDILSLKRHCDWTSDQVAEGYVRNSKKQKKDIANLLLGNPAESTTTTEPDLEGRVCLYGCTITNLILQK